MSKEYDLGRVVGRDATINGQNAIQLIAGGNIKIEQDGENVTIGVDGKVEQSCTADKLSTPRKIKTNLSSSNNANFDGTSDASPGVDGVLPITNGGTGNTTGLAASAAKLAAARNIDGVSFDGSVNITHYGTCSTGSSTAAKAVSLDGFSLVTGAEATVKFTYANTAASPTLNINSTGAKPIVKYDTTASMAYMWQAGEAVEFVYDGTNWVMKKGGLATTTYYGLAKLSSSISSTSTAEAATPSAVKQAYDLASAASTPDEVTLAVNSAKQWAAETFSNPNILMNGDFQLWSRGNTFTAADKFCYTADNWCGVLNGTLSRENNNTNKFGGKFYLTYTSAAPNFNHRIFQFIDNAVISAAFGKKVTVSGYHNGHNLRVSLIKKSTYDDKETNNTWSSLTHASIPDSSEWTKFSVTLDLSGIYTDNEDYILMFYWYSSNGTFSLANVKLEIGETATAFSPEVNALGVVKEVKQWIAANFSNPNILINGDFKVWQRGSGPFNAGRYSADRWYVKGEGTVTKKVTSSTDGLPFENYVYWKSEVKAQSHVLAQAIEKDILKSLLGQKVTLSCYHKGRAANICYAMEAPSVSHVSTQYTNVGSIADTDDEWVKHSVTFTMPAAVDETKPFYICFEYHSSNGEMWLANVKFEKGETATPFVPRSYAEELAACQRYFISLNPYKSLNLQPAAVGTGHGQALFNVRNFIVPLPQTMRIMPTLQWKGRWNLSNMGSTNAVTDITLMAPLSSTVNSVVISVTATNQLTANTPYTLWAYNDNTADITLDAEIYTANETEESE